MLMSCSATHVMNTIRDSQARTASDNESRFENNALVTTTVSAVIDFLNVHGFVVAKNVQEPEDTRLTTTRDILDAWKRAPSAARESVRQAYPALGLALDTLETSQ